MKIYNIFTTFYNYIFKTVPFAHIYIQILLHLPNVYCLLDTDRAVSLSYQLLSFILRNTK